MNDISIIEYKIISMEKKIRIESIKLVIAKQTNQGIIYFGKKKQQEQKKYEVVPKELFQEIMQNLEGRDDKIEAVREILKAMEFRMPEDFA